MLIHWKNLCGIGLSFWMGMCGYDYYHANILLAGEFQPEKSTTEKTESTKEMLNIKPNNLKEDILIDNISLYWFYIIIAASLITVLLVAAAVKIIHKRSRMRMASSDTQIMAPIPLPATFFDGYEHIEPLPEKLEVYHCTDFKKDEVVETTTSWKELSALNKKVESLNDEKRNLTKFLAQSEKDNRLIKQKMMEVLRDKNLLLKRLESATREIRSNTVARQATLDKLEESLQCSNQLKMQNQRITGEKSEMERKIKTLETQYKNLKKQNETTRINTNTNTNGMHQLTTSETAGDATKDIEQIELKLHDLELSLEKMKCKSIEKGEDNSEDNGARDSAEPKLVREVSSNDSSCLAEVEPSYTHLLKFEHREAAPSTQLEEIVESAGPQRNPVGFKLNNPNKFEVINMFGNSLFNLLYNVQQQNTNSINGLVRRRNFINFVNCPIDFGQTSSPRQSTNSSSETLIMVKDNNVQKDDKKSKRESINENN